MELHTDQGNFQGLKILIAASVNSQNLQVKLVKPTDQEVPYLVRNRLPVLVTSKGTQLFSANSASSLIFAESGNKGDAVKADQWLEWENSSLLPVVHRAVLAGKLDDVLTAPVKAQLGVLEADLSSQYILGNSLTVVDVVVWSTVFPLVNCSDQTKAVVASFPKTMQWFDTLAAQPAFKDAVGAMYKTSIKEALKASVSVAPVPPSAAASTCRLLGLDKVNKPAADSPTEEEAVVTAEEKSSATEAWETGRSNLPHHEKRSHPILPQEGRKNVLITSALPYVNNVPHLGNIIGCVLSADVYARFCRLRGYNTLYVSGTDEYGTATETKALAEGLTPLQICDKYNKLHTEIYEWFNIDFDYFGRTTTKQQTEIAQDIFWRLHENGNILKDSVEQLKCVQCSRFLADRFVEGTCPFCAYEDARGDQCDKCGKLINAPDLINPRCKTCGKTPIICSTDHLFLDLPKLAPALEKYLDTHFEKGIWTNNCKVITKAWIRDGLKPRCISRDLKWGTQVPLEGYTEKVFYVWYDAPIGYISITANYTSEWERWWKNPEQVSLYQFMAKDNVPFHSVIFPCSLIGTNQKWTMVNHLSATEYLNYEDTKFSKSRGTGVFGNDAQETGIPSDIWRFYLLFLRPESQDSSFSWDDFLLKNNSELLNNLGNFIQRALAFVANNFGGVVPEVALTEEDKELLAHVTRELVNYVNNLEKIKLRDAIRNILSISRLGNQYIQMNKPWVLVKGTEPEKARAGSVVALAANMAALLSVMVQPYMPTISATIQQQVNLPARFNLVTDKFVCLLPKGHKIGTPSPLFQKIEADKIAELKKKFAGAQVAVAAGGAPTASPEVIAAVTAAIAKQGEVVRLLKAAKAEKGVVNVEVAALLDLKKQLAALSGPPAPEPAKGKKKGNQQKQQGGDGKKKNAPATSGQAAPGAVLESPEVIKQLLEQVSIQGNIVRDVKAAKADKAVIDAEIAKLLDLKKVLAVSMGQDPSEVAGGGRKKKAAQAKEAPSNNPPAASAPAAPAATAASGPVLESPAVVKQLLEQVTIQGNVVRDVKAAKADKAVIDAAVAKLLDLKKLLAVSMGQDPTEAVGGGSKKKKSKKK